jgi:6-phosphofructokinase 2
MNLPANRKEIGMLTVTLNPSLDICATVPVVESERKMRCTNVTIEPGGGGVNVARVAVRFGEPVTAAVFLREDSSGEFLSLLANEGVPVAVVPVSGKMREGFTAHEASTSRQLRFVLPGPSISPDEFAAGIERLVGLCADERLVVLSGSSPPGVSPSDLARLVRRIKQAGCEVIADVPGDALAEVSAAGVMLVKPSVRELSEFAGRSVVGHGHIEQAALDLLATGSTGAALVSMGPAGVLLVRTGHETIWFHAPHVQTHSTIGAGDSLVGGVAVALQRGAPLPEACRVGVAAGTAATLATGTGLCQAADVDRLAADVLVTARAGMGA